jgi:hypothetical protein
MRLMNTSAFDINLSIALDQRFYLMSNVLDQGFSSLRRGIDFGLIPKIAYHLKESSVYSLQSMLHPINSISTNGNIKVSRSMRFVCCSFIATLMNPEHLA